MTVAVVVPVLNRPERVAPLAKSLLDSIRAVHCSLYFVCSPGDDAEIAAVQAWALTLGTSFLLAEWTPGRADWAAKINLAYRLTDAPWIFTGADDLCFHPGWADRALECAAATGAQVIGTNDLGNPRVTRGDHATHSLVARRYADEYGTIDGPGAVVSEKYDHNFCDDELVATARARDLWTFCKASEVPHLHPHWGKAKMDATYEKGLADFDADRRIFQKRRRRIARAR